MKITTNNISPKKHFIMLFVMIVTSFLFSGCESEITSNKNDFITIFDGKTLNGWHGDPTYWTVKNGVLVGQITPDTLLNRNSFVIWQGDMPADFELRVEYKISRNGNSGINYRSEQVEGIPYALRGYQADIDGANHYTGSNYEERKRTTLADRGEITILPALEDTGQLSQYVEKNHWTPRHVTGTLGTKEALTSKIKSEQWNECVIIADGNHLQHFVNGFLMSDVTDNDPVNRRADGLLGVQVHVGPPMKVEYRNFRLKKL